MAIEKVAGGIVITGEIDIRRVQALAQRSALRLELKGLKRRGPSLFSRIKRAHGLRGSRQSVYKRFCALHGLEE